MCVFVLYVYTDVMAIVTVVTVVRVNKGSVACGRPVHVGQVILYGLGGNRW